MDKTKLVEQIQENLKDIYHKAIDADSVLKQQQEQGKAKFSALFKDSLFKDQHRQFLPYVEELASDLVLLQECQDDEHFVTQLKVMVAKLEQMHKLLVEFKQLTRQ
ncbi:MULTISPECIES: primosomal replication protein PriC [unclassified Agarivorans]|uniref:primosomal replication protein PriC n=1 Tax=unclassified Agarivorans TaxID=2636026 RepID=UPI0026E125EA|nr:MULTISPECIES: primosomal replication protein PriC [unclassified Agarivorans]MDO6687410.1 primosomal replication protein PriC [Agarivorans sp. 3_MG-2023]MDO6715176.1 primosomal replication protein PriC [Agarivorans sp. 2_MG-2023]MDO6763527.1 primosomal replication protein PriC [Agarivorans sp. 1_MG-2023]